MFLRLHDSRPLVEIRVDGRPVLAREGESVAAALLAAAVSTFRRSARSGSERGAYCGMGACFECLVMIDGRPNVQSCLVPVVAGMEVATGQAAPDLGAKIAP
jgi:predicted molibdopterin-dependent oxidoreductase YjgC